MPPYSHHLQVNWLKHHHHHHHHQYHSPGEIIVIVSTMEEVLNMKLEKYCGSQENARRTVNGNCQVKSTSWIKIIKWNLINIDDSYCIVKIISCKLYTFNLSFALLYKVKFCKTFHVNIFSGMSMRQPSRTWRSWIWSFRWDCLSQHLISCFKFCHRYFSFGHNW